MSEANGDLIEEDSVSGIVFHVVATLIIAVYHGYFWSYSVDTSRNPRLKLFLARAEAWLQLLTTHSDRTITAVQMLRNITGVHAALAGVSALGGVLIAMKGGNSNALFAGIGLAFYAAAFSCFGLCCRVVANLEYMISLFPVDAATKWVVHEQGAELQRRQIGNAPSSSMAVGSASSVPPTARGGGFPSSPALQGLTPPSGSPAAMTPPTTEDDVTPTTTPTTTTTSGARRKNFGAIPTSVVPLPQVEHLEKPFNPDSNERRCRNSLRVLVLTSNTGLRFVFIALTITFMIFGPFYLLVASVVNCLGCFLVFDNPNGGFARDLRQSCASCGIQVTAEKATNVGVHAA